DLVLRYERKEHEAYVFGSGDVSPTSAGDLEAMLKQGMDESGVSKVVLDITDLAFMHSDGLRSIANTVRYSIPLEKELEIRNPTVALDKIFKVTGLAEYVTVVHIQTED